MPSIGQYRPLSQSTQSEPEGHAITVYCSTYPPRAFWGILKKMVRRERDQGPNSNFYSADRGQATVLIYNWINQF
jgi:hypothetical protein